MRVSVIMSAYNENLSDVRESINSILNQDFSDFEFIIILDNPDNILLENEIIKLKNTDSRIIFIKNDKNIGLAASLNKAASIASGEYIARMDADDISVFNRLSKQLSIFSKYPNLDIVSTNKIDIDENGTIISDFKDMPIYDYDIKKYLSYVSIIVHPSVMFKKKMFDELGGYNLFPASQDYDLWLRARSKGYMFYIINEPLLKYRHRFNNISSLHSYKSTLIHYYIKRHSKFGYKFNINSLNNYLNKHKYNNEMMIKRFNKGANFLNLSKISFKEKKYFKALFNIFKSIFCHRLYLFIVYDHLMCFFLKKKWRKICV